MREWMRNAHQAGWHRRIKSILSQHERDRIFFFPGKAEMMKMNRRWRLSNLKKR